MGRHYFHGAPQLGRSQGCRLMELDGWTVTRTTQVDPPQPPARPPLPETQTHAHTHINAKTCTKPTHKHIISKGECVQLQGEMWQRRHQLSSRQMSWDVGGLMVFPAEVWNPAAVGCWRLVLYSPSLSLWYCPLQRQYSKLYLSNRWSNELYSGIQEQSMSQCESFHLFVWMFCTFKEDFFFKKFC